MTISSSPARLHVPRRAQGEEALPGPGPFSHHGPGPFLCADSSYVAETPLEKVLRLAGGITRQYVRMGEHGPVAVRQYATPQRRRSITPPPDPLARPGAAAAANQGSGALNQGTRAFSAVRRGQLVELASQRYRVMQVNAGSPSPGSGHHGVGGSGLATGSGGPISHGRVTNRAGGPGYHPAPLAPRIAHGSGRNPADVAMGGRPIPKGTPTVTSVLSSVSDGRHWYVTLPASYVVRVVG